MGEPHSLMTLWGRRLCLGELCYVRIVVMAFASLGSVWAVGCQQCNSCRCLPSVWCLLPCWMRSTFLSCKSALLALRFLPRFAFWRERLLTRWMCSACYHC